MNIATTTLPVLWPHTILKSRFDGKEEEVVFAEEVEETDHYIVKFASHEADVVRKISKQELFQGWSIKTLARCPVCSARPDLNILSKIK